MEDDGHLVLRTREGMVNSYLFKEVEFVLYDEIIIVKIWQDLNAFY